MSSISDYFSLRKSFVFYGSYHHEWRNQLIHVFGVPLIYSTALAFASFVPLGSTGYTLSDVTAAFYAISFVIMEPGAGLLYAPVIAGMHYWGTKILSQNISLAVAIHVAAWIAQFVGHGVFEKRKPALLDNLLQSIHAAVFFVWLEVLFQLGYRPSLRKELEALVVARMAKFKKTAE